MFTLTNHCISNDKQEKAEKEEFFQKEKFELSEPPN